jgi:phosphopantothenoylcysteine decarboxylase / phosphopantothenate---cysteine ligase
VAKGLHLICANDVTEPGSGFGTDTNRVTILGRDGSREDLPLLGKDAVAGRLLDRIESLLS